ncbi:MAG: hypothetical protein U0L09_10285, partial [Christensenellales bacterium]|nr:hypothetical protein [Christensenellales bacterium]
MLHVYTGRNRLMAPALCAAVRALGEAPQIIVVPRQLTLQTERMLLDALQLKGSFQLQVLTAERLCARIFAETGLPEGARVDDRGRVMLVRAALQAARAQLTVYRGQEHRRGFPERAAKQLECIRQAGIAPETLRACADAQTGVTAMKLNDLSHILEAYEMLLEGRYQDGESEFNAASARAGEAPFLRDRAVWFFGFDMMPPTLHHLIAAVAAACPRTGLFLPLENDSSARDFDAFLPMQRAFTRIVGAAKLAGTAVRRVEVAEGDGPFRFPDAEANLFGLIPGRDRVEVRAPGCRAELRLLEQELFAFPPKPSNMPARSVQLILTANPGEECHFAAALTRRLVMERNWRWNDVMLLCQDVENYAQPLKTAFAAYGIPLFLSSSRSAARHATAECLLTALLCVQKGFLPEDMLALARTGLMPVTDDEADRLANYAVRYGLRGARFLHPLRRSSEAEIDALEPVRARLTEPLIRLRELLRRARTLDDQLAALYAFLTDVDAFGKSQRRMALLAEAGLREAAGEEGQVWNRIIGTLDQMHSLMGPQRLPLREIHETLLESLSAAVIKPLPQSGDAVYAQNTDSALTRPYRAVLLLGASDRTVSEGDGLLTQAQTQTLSGFADAYLGPGDADLSRLR